MTIVNYKELSKFTSLPVGTLYSMVSKKQIPHFRLGKRIVRFSKDEIDTWMQGGHFSAKGAKRWK